MTGPDPFQRAEDEFFRLKGQLSAGRITRAQFDAALQSLIVQDEQGQSWSLGADSGKWYVHSGGQWVEAAPPGHGPVKPVSLPERGAPAPAPVPPPKPNRTPLLILGALVIVGVIAAAIWLLASNSAAPATVAAQITSTPASAMALPTVTLASASGAPSDTTAPGSETPTATIPPTATPQLAVSNVSGVQVLVVPAAAPSRIAAGNFAKLNTELAEKIAELNFAELKFIRDAKASALNGRMTGLAFPPPQGNPALTDEDLKDLAGKAMDVAILSDRLGEVAAKQDKGSQQAAQSAEAYFNIARNAFSLVVDTQGLRDKLSQRLIPITDAIQTVANYGASLWSVEATDGTTKGNPFTPQSKNAEPVQPLNANAAAQVQSQFNGNNAAIWMAQSDIPATKTLSVPPAQAAVTNPFDPQVLQGLTTAAGQADGSKAVQVAAENLKRLGATTTSTDPAAPQQLQVPVKPVTVAEAAQIKNGDVPSFPKGKAVIVSQNGDDGSDPFMQNLGLDGSQPPTDDGKVAVQDAPALVNLSISDISIDNVKQQDKSVQSSFEANTSFSFTVHWTTPLVSPQFTVSCNSGSAFTVSAGSGTLTIHATAPMILYPGTVDAYCYATSENGTSLGSTSVRVLVGDAAGATRRALQVETDSASLNATFTAEAQGTTQAQQTQAAETAAVEQTANALSTEVAATNTAEFKLTAAAFETKQAQPPPEPPTPTATPTFAPQLIETLSHPGNVMAVSTHSVLQKGRMYRFTFGGKINLINPTHSVSANELPEHVNGITVPVNGIVVLEGTGSTATISCGSGEPDPDNPGAFSITVEDLGPM